MDFGSVLHKAQKNEQNSRQNNNWYKTSFSPPKKEQREKKLSLNIQKFLAKKEEEEKKKKIEAERKKQELLSLRNKDKKSKKRIQSMLTKTKSANKSVLEDAIDNVNTAVTVAGPLQPDEDDYGYVSKDASEWYDKLINKYSNMPPDEVKFSKSTVKCSNDISYTKDRVKAALQKEEEDKLLPRKRKRKSKGETANKDNEDEDDIKPSNDEEPVINEKPKIQKKFAHPPPMDFQSLLKLAEKKQFEPIMVEKVIDDKPDRPMTEKEKQEYLREKERKKRRELELTGINLKESNVNKKNEIASKTEQKEKKIINKQSSDVQLKNNPHLITSRNSLNNNKEKYYDKISQQKVLQKKIENSFSGEDIKKSKSVHENIKQHKTCNINGEKNDKLNQLLQLEKTINRNSFDNPKMKQINPNMSTKEKSILLKRDEKNLAEKNKINTGYNNAKSKMSDSIINFNKKSNETKLQHSTLASVKQFPPRDVKNLPKPKLKRPTILSDDEYDSEMDDFIDDSEDHNDVSKYISEIFGYDRNRYSRMDVDDDNDECMESNFSQLQKEEFISTKYGILEDLEDIRRTKIEKDRKKKKLLPPAKH